MTSKSNVLVFPCGSEIGLELHNALHLSKDVVLHGGSSVSDHGQYVYQNYSADFPFFNHPDFVPVLRNYINRYNIDFVFPAHDDVVLLLSRVQNELPCKVIGSPRDTCEICRSKSITYKHLRQHGILVPEDYEFSTCLPFPVFLKPDIGQGSKRTFLAHNYAEVEFYCKQNPDLIILEYLPGSEYTIDCLTDRHGQLLFAGARERIRIQNGISVNTRPVNDSRFHDLAVEINRVMTLRGAWFFQVKKNARNELSVMEVAPRIAGSMGMYRNLGVNFPLLSLYVADNKDIQILLNNYPIEMDRALFNRFRLNLMFKHVYVDLDDTLVVKGKVNTALLSFLYQCLNQDIQLHLITRCEEDLQQKLRLHRLNQLFDTIVHIQDRTLKKSAYIQEADAIFIDDSFSERYEVNSMLGIPVFDLDMIESLLVWRS